MQMKRTSRLIVFPVGGRKWSFATPRNTCDNSNVPLTFKQLLTNIHQHHGLAPKADLLTHFVSHKMQQKWIALEKAPLGSFRQRVYSLGQQLLARVKPSETFLKSIPREMNTVEIVFPLSLNPRLVRRRLRCVATSGVIYHRRYMYGSVALLPVTALFAVLPLPNIPLFWNLFRAHAHWQALKGSERLLSLVSDSLESGNIIKAKSDKDETANASQGDSNSGEENYTLILQPCGQLENILAPEAKTGALTDSTISTICKTYNIDYLEVLKWRDYKL